MNKFIFIFIFIGLIFANFTFADFNIIDQPDQSAIWDSQVAGGGSGYISAIINLENGATTGSEVVKSISFIHRQKELWDSECNVNAGYTVNVDYDNTSLVIQGAFLPSTQWKEVTLDIAYAAIPAFMLEAIVIDSSNIGCGSSGYPYLGQRMQLKGSNSNPLPLVNMVSNNGGDFDPYLKVVTSNEYTIDLDRSIYPQGFVSNDFENWRVCINTPNPTSDTGLKVFVRYGVMGSDVNAYNQDSFVFDMDKNYFSGCINLAKSIALTPERYTVLVYLYSGVGDPDAYGLKAHNGVYFRIVEGDPIAFPINQVNNDLGFSVENGNPCVATGFNLLGIDFGRNLCGILIPNNLALLFQERLDHIKEKTNEVIPFTWINQTKAKLEEWRDQQSTDPFFSFDIQTPIGTTFNIKPFDNSSNNPLGESQDQVINAYKPFLRTGLWLLFFTYISFRFMSFVTSKRL